MLRLRLLRPSAAVLPCCCMGLAEQTQVRTGTKYSMHVTKEEREAKQKAREQRRKNPKHPRQDRHLKNLVGLSPTACFLLGRCTAALQPPTVCAHATSS